jgi:FkbM family methyltransferase
MTIPFSKKLRPLKDCVSFASQGANWRSKRILLYVGILAHIWPARKPRLLRYLQTSLARQARDSLLEIALSADRAVSSSALSVVFRVGNRADYQTLWECLNDEIYVRPQLPIAFLFDGGANLGLFTIAVCRLLEIEQAIVVEPDPENVRLMRRNLTSIPQAMVVEAALAANESDIQFTRADSNTGYIAGAPSSAAGEEAITVHCKTLSGSMPAMWDMSRTWLKLDIEGAEYAVVPELLESPLRPAAISLEIHEYESAGGDSLVHKLREAGYEISMLDPGAPTNTCRQILAVRSSEG